MTLQDYAKYLLSACGRRFTNLYRRHYLESTNALPSLSALLSYLRTQTASIYAYLQTRFAGDPTSGIPSITPTSPLTFANLLTNIQKLATRKIDAGTSTQIPDGMSLVRLLCDTTAASAVTELIDTNTGWTMGNYSVISTFSNLSKLSIGSKILTGTSPNYGYLLSNSTITQLLFPNLIKVHQENYGGTLYCPNAIISMPRLEVLEGYSYHHSNGYALISSCKNETLDLSSLKSIVSTGSQVGSTSIVPIAANCSYLKNVIMPSMKSFNNVDSISQYNSVLYFRNCPNIEKIVVGTLTSFASYNIFNYSYNSTMTKLLHFEIGQDTAISLNLRYWNPTLDTQEKIDTLKSNFQTYILNRLSTSVTGRTLTVSASVFAAVSDLEVPAGWTLVSA